MMKVLFISHVSNKLGAARSLLDLMDGLSQKGVKCYVIMPSDGPLAEELKKRGSYTVLCPSSTGSLPRIALGGNACCVWGLTYSRRSGLPSRREHGVSISFTAIAA